MKIRESELRQMIKDSIRQVLREEVGDIDYNNEDTARKANAIMNEIQELGIEENGLGRIRDLVNCSTPQIIIDFFGDMRDPRYKAGVKSGWENEKVKCLKIAEKYDCYIHIIQDEIVFTLNRHFDKRHWDMWTIPLFDNYGKPKS